MKKTVSCSELPNRCVGNKGTDDEQETVMDEHRISVNTAKHPNSHEEALILSSIKFNSLYCL